MRGERGTDVGSTFAAVIFLYIFFFVFFVRGRRLRPLRYGRRPGHGYSKYEPTSCIGGVHSRNPAEYYRTLETVLRMSS